MSGPKHTQVRPSPRRVARRQLSPLTTELEAARATLRESMARRAAHGQRDLDAALHALRAELAKFRGSPESRAALLDALRAAENCRSRLAAESATAPTPQDVESVLTEIDRLLSGGALGAIDSAASRARALLSRVAHVAAVEREADCTLATVNRLLDTANSATAEAEQAARQLLEAAKATIDAESHALAAEDQVLIELGSLRRSDHRSALDSARSRLEAGDPTGAAQLVDEARSMRIAAHLNGSTVRTRIEMRDELAGHLASTLRSKNYDECHAYLKAGPGGDERPLVIYANNPSGKAHVRITLPIDDEMTIEVDGVADGEEEICVDVLESFQRALEATGDGMDVIDAGRAAPFM